MSSNETNSNGNVMGNDLQSNNDQEDSLVEFPSSDILLSAIQKEYDIESNRKRDLETRTGILIALLGALLGFYSNVIDLSFFKKANTNLEIILFVFISLLYAFPIVSLILSLRKFILVLSTKEYARMGLEGFREAIARKPKDKVSIDMAKSYKEMVEVNDNLNSEKAVQFKKGIDLLFISLIGTVVVYIVKEVIKLFI